MNQIFKIRYFALSILLSLTTDMIADDESEDVAPDQISFEDYVFFTSDKDPSQVDMVKDLVVGEANNPMSFADCRVNANRYTGVPHVEIPLYSTAQRGLSLDVQLQYNSSGIKVHSLPSWTGYEWKLKAGGMISRVVQGKCDEAGNGLSGYFYHIDDLKYAVRDYLLFPDAKRKWNSLHHRLIGDFDYSPDIFYFSFFGKSGRFFYGQDDQWHVLSESNLFIDFNIRDTTNYIEPYFLYNGYDDNESYNGMKAPIKTKRLQHKTIKGFTIVDEDGTKYIFGNKERNTSPLDTSMYFNHYGACNIDYSIPLENLHADTLSKAPTMQADTWYLTEVIDRFGEVLYEFEYERGEFIVDVRPNIHSEVVKAVTNEYGNMVPTFLQLQIPDYRNLDSLRAYYSNLNMSSHGIDPASKTATKSGKKKKKQQGPYDLRVKSPVYLKKINMPGSRDSIVFSRSGERDAITSEILYPSLYKYYQTNSLCGPLCELYGFTAIKGSKAFTLLQTTSDSITKFHSAQSRENFVRKSSDPLYSMAIRTLKDISIYRKGIRLKKYEFAYTDKGRKLMTEVQIQDGNKPAGNYKFCYCNPEGIPVDVLCTSTDQWGYYAGNVEGLAPEHTPLRNEECTMCGMLVGVKKPQGSVMELSYSPNQYWRFRSDDRCAFYDSGGPAGGLRVSEIVTFNDASKQDTLSSVRYEYSGGELYSLPKKTIEHNQMTPNNDKIVIGFFNYNCVLPYQNAYGEHIGYSKVTERYRNGSYKTFTYSNLSSHSDSLPILSAGMIDAFGELDYKRGKIQKEELFDARGNLVQEIGYTYRTDNTENNYVLAGNLMLNAIESKDFKMFPCTYAYYTGSIYKLFYPKYDLVEARTVTYEQGGSITDTVSYVKCDYTLTIGKARVDVRKCEGKRLKRGTVPYSLYESYSYESLTDTSFLHQFFLPMTKTERMYQKRVKVQVEDPSYLDPRATDGHGHPITDGNGNQLDVYIPDEMRIPEVSYTYEIIGFIGGKQTDYKSFLSRNGIRTMVPAKEIKLYVPTINDANKGTDNGSIINHLSKIQDSAIPEVEYWYYHGDGQPKYYQEKGRPETRVFFDKEDRIVAKVTSSAELLDMDFNENATTPEDVITLNDVSVFSLPCTEAIVYRYNEMGLVESATIGRGMTVHYRYDNIGRLVEERDAQGRILKRYSYNISYK